MGRASNASTPSLVVGVIRSGGAVGLIFSKLADAVGLFEKVVAVAERLLRVLVVATVIAWTC